MGAIVLGEVTDRASPEIVDYTHDLADLTLASSRFHPIIPDVLNHLVAQNHEPTTVLQFRARLPDLIPRQLPPRLEEAVVTMGTEVEGRVLATLYDEWGAARLAEQRMAQNPRRRRNDDAAERALMVQAAAKRTAVALDKLNAAIRKAAEHEVMTIAVLSTQHRYDFPAFDIAGVVSSWDHFIALRPNARDQLGDAFTDAVQSAMDQALAITRAMAAGEMELLGVRPKFEHARADGEIWRTLVQGGSTGFDPMFRNLRDAFILSVIQRAEIALGVKDELRPVAFVCAAAAFHGEWTVRVARWRVHFSNLWIALGGRGDAQANNRALLVLDSDCPIAMPLRLRGPPAYVANYLLWRWRSLEKRTPVTLKALRSECQQYLANLFTDPNAVAMWVEYLLAEVRCEQDF